MKVKKIVFFLLILMLTATLMTDCSSFGPAESTETASGGVFTIFGVTASDQSGSQEIYLKEFGYTRSSGNSITTACGIAPYQGEYDEASTLTFPSGTEEKIIVTADRFDHANIQIHGADGTVYYDGFGKGMELRDEIILDVPTEPGEYIYSIHIYWSSDNVICGFKVVVE